MDLGGVMIAVLAVVLLVAAVLLVRSRETTSWPAIVVAMVTSGICFTIGGDSTTEGSGPSPATVAASIVGVVSVIAAIIAMVPRSREAPPSRIATVLAAAAIVVGALGLVINQLSN